MKNSVSVEFLRNHFRYEPESGQVFWIVDNPGNGMLRRAGDCAGVLNNAGYLSIFIGGNHLLAHRVAWALQYGDWPDMRIDHINRNRSDNNIRNLRLATHQQNMFNTKTPTTNSVGIKGAHKERGRFRSQIKAGGFRLNLGMFDTPEQAHEAYKAAAIRLHGEFAPLDL